MFQQKRSSKALVTVGFLAVSIGLGLLQQVGGYAQGTLHGAAGEPGVPANGPSGGVLENDRIAAVWKLNGDHLAGLAIRDKFAGKDDRLELNGPFSIELKDGGILRASKLLIQGPARVEHFTPDPADSRFSDRVPGIAVHFTLADPAGQYQADSALVLRDGSSYIRQVLTVHAGTKPVPVSSVTMIDARFPGMAVAGTVKGSPLTASNFYLGFESPLSESSVVDDRGVSELHSGVPIGAGQSAEYLR